MRISSLWQILYHKSNLYQFAHIVKVNTCDISICSNWQKDDKIRRSPADLISLESDGSWKKKLEIFKAFLVALACH